jgi:hypothetical protein
VAEPLATGWEPGVPDGDTLVRAGVHSVADRVLHQARAIGRTAYQDDHLVAAHLADRGMFSNAVVLLTPPDDWSAVPRAVDEHIPAGLPALLLSPFLTPDLTGAGLVPVGHPPFMVRAAGGDAPAPPAGIEIREVIDPRDLIDFERTLIVGYPVPDMAADALPVLFPPASLGGSSHYYLALDDGTPVATAATHVAAGVNHVEFVATVPSHRGRGIGAAITWAATVAAPELPAVLIASDDGRGVYEALGYLAVVRWTLWYRP